jgi:hypothetical protein
LKGSFTDDVQEKEVSSEKIVNESMEKTKEETKKDS